MAMDSDNDIIIEAWNTVLFDKFNRFKHLLVEGLSGHSDTFLERRKYPQGAHIVDIGCGFGDTTVQLGKLVGPSGKVTGIDCAPRFVAAGKALALESETPHVEFLARDVQFEALGGPFDFAFARFGTMFFNMPGAAMRNIRKHLKPGGRLDMIVWRKREDNPWLHEAELAVRELVPVVSHEETDQVHCGPGLFSMSGPDMVSSILQAAGFEQVSFTRNDDDVCIGRSLEEAVLFAQQLGPAGEIMRLAGPAGEAKRPEVEAALRAVLSQYQQEDGSIWAPSSTWFVGGIAAG